MDPESSRTKSRLGRTAALRVNSGSVAGCARLDVGMAVMHIQAAHRPQAALKRKPGKASVEKRRVGKFFIITLQKFVESASSGR